MKKFSSLKMQKALGIDFIDSYVNKYSEHPESKLETYGMDTFIINETLGLDISYDEENELKALFFYGYEHEDYNQFDKPLPFNLRFDLSRDDLRNLFGEPFKSYEAILALEVNAGDIYKQDGYYISFEYTKDFKKLSIVKVYLWD